MEKTPRPQQTQNKPQKTDFKSTISKYVSLKALGMTGKCHNKYHIKRTKVGNNRE